MLVVDVERDLVAQHSSLVGVDGVGPALVHFFLSLYLELGEHLGKVEIFWLSVPHAGNHALAFLHSIGKPIFFYARAFLIRALLLKGVLLELAQWDDGLLGFAHVRRILLIVDLGLAEEAVNGCGYLFEVQYLKVGQNFGVALEHLELFVKEGNPVGETVEELFGKRELRRRYFLIRMRSNVMLE